MLDLSAFLAFNHTFYSTGDDGKFINVQLRFCQQMFQMRSFTK